MNCSLLVSIQKKIIKKSFFLISPRIYLFAELIGDNCMTRSFIIYTLHQILYKRDKIKWLEVGEAYSMHLGDKKYLQNYSCKFLMGAIFLKPCA
jgi:hypothetical protein